MWDLFISHASEDKDCLVRPLAEELRKYGVDVWYDEFSLNLGDSLTESINKGLSNSKFGLLIISKAFFEKRWTDYELKSLLTKEINGQKVILPVWHDVNPQYVASKNLYLADKKAISSNEGIEKLAYAIVRVVRPDIINSHLTKLAARAAKTSDKTERVRLKDMYVIEGVRHETLPPHLVIASRMFSTLFPLTSHKEVLINFAKDADYDGEFVLWTVISCAFIDAMKTLGAVYSDKEFTDKLFFYLLWLSLNDDERCNEIDLDESTKRVLAQAYLYHAEALFPLIKNNQKG